MKNILYAIVVVSLLVTALGLQGARSAAAAVGWNDDGTLVTDTTLPYYYGILNMSTAIGSAGGDQGGCSAVAVFGQYQSHLLDDVALNTPAGFYRVRVESNLDTGSYQWAVLVRDAATNVEIACAIAVSGLVDMTVPVDPGVDVVITVTNIGFYVPTDTTFKTYIARNLKGGGLIVDMNGDGGNTNGRAVLASSVGSDDVYYDNWAVGTWVDFLDIPDGSYNLGVSDTTAGQAFAAYYPGLAAPDLVALTPHNDAVIPLTIDAKDETGADLAFARVNIIPNDGGLQRSLFVGETDLAGNLAFRVNPGYLWDLGIYDIGFKNYLLISLAFNPTLGTLMVDASASSTWVRTCFDADYDFFGLNFDPPGALEEWAFGFMGFSCLDWYLTADSAFDITTDLVESDWDYYYLPTIPVWDFPLTDYTDPAVMPSYDPIFGDIPFLTGPLPNATSQELYTLPLAAGEVALGRGGWTDQFGNLLTEITAPDDTEITCDYTGLVLDADLTGDRIQPCYAVATVATGFVELANDWDTTDLGPVTDVGRYQYERALQHGPNLTVPIAPGGFFVYDDLFAIQPADMSMMTDWSWSWVMAMYEYDLTNGLNGGGYAPNAPVTRAQMAAFLSRVLDLFGVAPTGAAPAFSDVPAAYWASAEIAHLRDYGITTGTNWCNGVAVVNTFCPNANVTRAEMAKFIEVTFRTIKVFAGIDFYWPEEQNIYIHGITFIDVPVDYWANVWVEEFFFDQLTDGCMRDGLNLYYCPGDEVTRGQMAKFIIRAIQPDFATQGFWPILAPSK